VRRVVRWILITLAAAFSFLAYVYLTVPDVRPLATTNPSTTSFIELRAAEAHAKGRPARRDQRWVAYERISQNLKRAVLVAEDSAFWHHDGLDVKELRKSIEHDFKKRRLSRGGSTITQQLAKNLYLSPSRNPIRKLRELILARRLEVELSKRRILELYLNVVEWGDGIYGAEAAAREYFHTSAAMLGPREAALMAGALVNPRALQIGHPNARLLGRQQLILQRMGSVIPPPAVPVINSAPPIVQPLTPDATPEPVPSLPETPPTAQPDPPSSR
jgi:monofunctional biosynthetic peptidoglycan transglycosylase